MFNLKEKSNKRFITASSFGIKKSEDTIGKSESINRRRTDNTIDK
jgi:hypothetical protein